MPESSALAIGVRAPRFTLLDERGRKVALRDFIGKKNVILVFYPGDMTPGCTLQLCAIRNDYKKFTTAGTVVFGVNHANATSHANFAEKHRFPFPLLVDPGKRVSAKYGAVKPFFKTAIIKRTVVGIGKDGKIFYYKRGMPKDSDILKAVNAIASSNA
jgi:peroxiredoxin Q/BCP